MVGTAIDRAVSYRTLGGAGGHTPQLVESLHMELFVGISSFLLIHAR